MFPVRVIAGMICFTAFFGIAIGLGAWLPNIMNGKGFTITKSLQYTLVMNFAVPCASIFMMYALDKYGRKITSVCAFVAAGIMAIVFANAGTPMELMVAGFIMVFFVQVAGNSMQIFTSEVFPTNARASGFGWASGVGRLATAFIMPTILWVQNGWGLTTVFVCLAVSVVDRRRVGDAARPRSAAEKPRRDRAADGMTTRIVWLATVVLCFVAAAPAAAQTSGTANWRIYQNDRYGTTIDYPDLFKAEPPPDNDDGRRFKSADGAEFAVFASYGALDFDLAGYQRYILEKLGPGKAVTYQARGDDWFVISGTKGDGIFYERYMLSHGKEMAEGFVEGFVMSYPAALKQTYDPIVARMAKSFRSGSGFQSPKR